MAVNSLVALVIFIPSAVALNLDPPQYLGTFPSNPTRWPYGGCVEVSKIYPAPGSRLPPSLNKYAKEWNVTVTVVFSRPVTRVLWKFRNNTWRYQLGRYVNGGDLQLTIKCAKNACLFLKLDGMYINYTSTYSGPTKRGDVFSDEYYFTFTLPSYITDHVSEIQFALDGGWMYSPVYKFVTNPDVEYVPYVAVRYLPPGNSSASSGPPERDSNYWVNHPSTCAARGGLIHRPFIFRRTKREQQMVDGDSPKLLTELSEIVNISSKEKRKLRLYYQMRWPGLHAVPFPEIINAVDKKTNLKISFSVPAIKSLTIRFTAPRLYIPVSTKYIFDYRERAYYDDPKWHDYFFTNKIRYGCDGDRSFDCNGFKYNGVLPNLSLPQIITNLTSDGFISSAEVKRLYPSLKKRRFTQFHFLGSFDNEPYPLLENHFRYEYHHYLNQFTRLVSAELECLQYKYENICDKPTKLVFDPYWKMISLFVGNNAELFDIFMICDEIKNALYRTEGNQPLLIHVNGTMRYSPTGSAYEKSMSEVLPLLNFKHNFNMYGRRQYNSSLLTDKCHYNVKRNVGKWGKLKTYIEYGNMYRLHVSKPPSSWSVQQTMNVRYIDKNGHQHTLNATIVSVPEHIKKAVRRYAVLTNVQPSVNSGAQRDTRLRGARESYPLEKAVFVPIGLTYKRGCRTLNITRNDISKVVRMYQTKYYHEHLCDKPPDDCTGLPFDSLDRFPLIPPFNVLDLIGPVDVMNVRKKHHRRALYYRDDVVNDLFILYSPNSYYTGVVEIGGVEVKEPEFVKKSCNDLWEFSADKYEITRGHVMATITNKGEGGGDVMLTIRCTPKLGVFPEEATVWVDPDQTKTVRFTLAGYLTESMEKKTAGYRCEMSITVDVTRYSSVVGKTFPICKMFIPTFGGSFLNPCESYLDHDITYYHLPKEFANDFSLKTFLSSKVGREYELVKIISIKLVKYHMIRLSCENEDVLALTEDHLITSSMNTDSVGTGNDINLVYGIDKLLQRRVYIFIKKEHSNKDIKTKCLLTLLSSPYISCGISSRKYIVLTKADIPEAIALEKIEAARKAVEIKKSIWNKWISEREEVISTVLVCTVTSLVLILLVVTGNTGLFIYTRLSSSEREIKQTREELLTAKREHKTKWNNPQMYLTKGILGPHYLLYKFKATDSLDTANLKVLKIAGTLKYKEKELQVIFGHVKKIVIKKTQVGITPDQVWLQASTGMYLLKRKYVSKEYEEEFNAFLQRHTRKATTS